MRYTLLYIITLFLLLSCSGKTEQEERYAEIVSQWQGREIKLPAVMTDFLTGDTINLDDADFTILTYVDSTGCTGCKMKLPIWKEYLQSIDSIDYADVSIIMAICPPKKNDLVYILREADFPYPVFFDKNDSLNELNSLPDKPALQSFLLDHNNHVIAIGNPSYNTSVRNLYTSIISGKKIYDYEGKSSITISDNGSFDFGIVKLQHEVNHQFNLTNVGYETVSIRKIVSSCECTTVSVPKMTIAPNEILPINVTFKEDSTTGNFSRLIQIFYHGFEYPIQFEITGTII